MPTAQKTRTTVVAKSKLRANPELRRLEEFFRSVVSQRVQRGDAKDVAFGLIESEMVKAGKFFIKVVTMDGVRYLSGPLGSPLGDAQSDAPDGWGRERETTPAEEPADEGIPQALWLRTKDEALPVHERASALHELVWREPAAVSDYVAEQLQRTDIKEDWQGVVVFLAEQVTFQVEVRENVGSCLLAIATRLRESMRAGADKVVWAALRRAVTLIPPAPEQLAMFLDRRGAIDTRSVALRCVQRMFELAPPVDPAAHRGVADRVYAFATKFLDRDVFASGENALIGQNAIFALAALDDPRAEEAVAAAKALERRWMNRQVAVGLDQILVAWRSNASLVKSHPAIERVESLISKLT